MEKRHNKYRLDLPEDRFRVKVYEMQQVWVITYTKSDALRTLTE